MRWNLGRTDNAMSTGRNNLGGAGTPLQRIGFGGGTPSLPRQRRV